MDPLPNLTLDDAQALYAKLAGAAVQQDNMVRAMATIAMVAKRKQAGWGRLRLKALRELGRFLIRNGRCRGRPAKTSADEDKLYLADLGITDHHLSADAKAVARVVERDFHAYMTEEMEPTLTGLLRFAERTRMGQQCPGGRQAGWRGSPFAVESTSTIEWFTPPEIFEAMETEFDLDVCSPGAELVPWIPAKRHLTRSQNGLVADWHGCVWLNPPYGVRNGIQEWIERFVEHGNGVALVPDFTSTGWWHALTERADAILFVRPKICFMPKRTDGPTNSLGSTLVAMGERGISALQNAERNGRGTCFRRSAPSSLALLEAAE